VVIEFFCEMDRIHDEELGFFEPRPWHQDRPQRPKVWSDDTPSNWWEPMSRHAPPGDTAAKMVRRPAHEPVPGARAPALTRAWVPRVEKKSAGRPKSRR
jgi:hypothetical protein